MVLLGKEGTPEKDLAPILSLVTDRQDFIVKAEAFYQSQKLPFGMFAKMTGANPIEDFTTLVASNRVNFS